MRTPIYDFIKGLVAVIDNRYSNTDTQTVVDFINRAGYKDLVNYGTNRLAIDVVGSDIPSIIPASIIALDPRREYVLKIAYYQEGGFDDNNNELMFDMKCGKAGVSARTFGFIFGGKVLVQEKLTRINSIDQMKRLAGKLKSFYTRCDSNAIVITDGSILSFKNFGLDADGIMKSLDFAYFVYVGRDEITDNVKDRQPITCPVCNTGRLTYSEWNEELSKGNYHDKYVCSNSKCIAGNPSYNLNLDIIVDSAKR